jgi:hypothetical protein
LLISVFDGSAVSSCRCHLLNFPFFGKRACFKIELDEERSRIGPFQLDLVLRSNSWSFDIDVDLEGLAELPKALEGHTAYSCAKFLLDPLWAVGWCPSTCRGAPYPSCDGYHEAVHGAQGKLP